MKSQLNHLLLYNYQLDSKLYKYRGLYLHNQCTDLNLNVKLGQLI